MTSNRKLYFKLLQIIIYVLTFFNTKTFALDSDVLNFDVWNEKYPHLSTPLVLEKGYVLSNYFKAGGNLNKRYNYAIYLYFINGSGSQTDWRILADALDYGTKKSEDGTPIFIDSGPTIPLKLMIYKLFNEKEVLVLNQKFDKLKASGGNNYMIGVPLTSIWLDPATYRISLEVLEVPNKIINIPVNFEIGLPGKH